jgi:hypothetical protein
MVMRVMTLILLVDEGSSDNETVMFDTPDNSFEGDVSGGGDGVSLKILMMTTLLQTPLDVDKLLIELGALAGLWIIFQTGAQWISNY